MIKKENIIGRVIRKYRNYHNYSRRALAEKMNLYEGTIYDYETGKITPPVEKLKKFHKILDIPFIEFFPDVLAIKEYSGKVEEKLTRYSVKEEKSVKNNISGILEKHPELVQVITIYDKNFQNLKDVNIISLLTKLSKLPKNERVTILKAINKIAGVR